MGATPRLAVFLAGGGPASPTVLGGKGAGLAEMAGLGLPVPPWFTLTTSVGRAFNQHGRLPRRMGWQIDRGMEALERAAGKRFGDADRPLLVSVRSGAPVSMPGMMDTVLNVGLNPLVVRGLAEATGSSRFSWDCYRRFLAMFGHTVRGIARERFDSVIEGIDLSSAADLRSVCDQYRGLIEEESGSPVPDCPRQQIEESLAAVFRSWDSPRAIAYRKAEGIDPGLGTAATVQAMVFGNRGPDSGTGVVFSRNTVSGAPGLWGEFLANAQGEDVVAGVRTPRDIAEMQAWNPTIHADLDRRVRELENHYGDVVDVEFTVEEGRLYVLQVRVAKRTLEAAATIATHFVWERRLTKEQALARFTRDELQALRAPAGFKPEALASLPSDRVLGRGLPASPGAAVGRVVCSSAAAVEAAKAGEQVVLVRPDTSPEDLPGMLAAVAVVTRTGGATCHAAVVARGQNKPAVVGCAGLRVLEGQIVSVDGQTGTIYEGGVEVEHGGASDKKEINLLLRWAHKLGALAPLPRLCFDHVEQPVSVHRLLNDFYLADAMAMASARTPLASRANKLRDETHWRTAELIAGYLAVAVAGELRHGRVDLMTGNCAQEMDVLRGKFKVIFDGGDRQRAQMAVVGTLKGVSVEEQAEFFALAVAVFEKGRWTSSCGGKKWAAIARAAHGFLTRAMDHSVFADHAFDLQHNNGTVFGKNKMFSGDRYVVGSQLDLKKRAGNAMELQKQLQPYDGFSSDVVELWRVGQELGLWRSSK